MDADQPLDRGRSSTPGLGEGALAQGSERYASMFTHHPHAAYSVDPRGYFTDANDRALEMTGLDLQQMRETHFTEVIHPEDRQLIRDTFDLVLGGATQVVEARILRPDGEVVDMRCTGIPVVVGGGVVGVHGITEDVTQAHRVLRQLELANAAKSRFLATVSHEVRTPLAVLIGATELLMDADLEAEPDHYARLVHRSSERLMMLVSDILEFSELENERTALKAAAFEVRAILQDVAAWAEPLAATQDLSISFVVDDSVPTISVGDALRVTQVVTNLVQNALKFTESGSVDVHVSAHPLQPDGTEEPAAGSWVDFTVTDTGIGIAEHHLQSLFEPFTQADRFASHHQGVGLGLAICRELVDLMGGRLEVSSVAGRGSTFTFGAPLGAPSSGPSSQGTDDLGGASVG